MKPAAPKLARCAIYTRKLTEHNLDLEFNSLDAQREACEAYIKSQAHEGWRLIPDRYDDGGLSGASLDRPALQTLLEQVRARKIDIIVVYKVDRLTRSLADFAKLVELFDAHAVSFVSVTQAFNTTSSMGKLTLNVLISFAQFEREVIGERVRDKIAASKRKGMWVGGPVPLGYATKEKKLFVVPAAAETVRSIFSRYLELGSLGALAVDLDRSGVRTRRRKSDTGPTGNAVPFSVGSLAHLLKNRFFVGDVVYRGEVYRGDHEPIIERKLFEVVQEKLAANTVERQLRLRGSASLLTGRLFDDRGNRMSPSHANKRGARYRYYVSQPVLQRRTKDAGSVVRVPASDVETLVLQGVKVHLADANIEVPAPTPARDLIEQYVERVTLKKDAIEVSVAQQGHVLEGQGPQDCSSKTEAAVSPGGQALAVLRLPWSAPVFAAVKGIVHTPSGPHGLKPETRDALLTAIAKARLWIDDLTAGRVTSLAEIAAREGKVERHIRLLAPCAVEASPSLKCVYP